MERYESKKVDDEIISQKVLPGPLTAKDLLNKLQSIIINLEADNATVSNQSDTE